MQVYIYIYIYIYRLLPTRQTYSVVSDDGESDGK